jgi:hypothetical protein
VSYYFKPHFNKSHSRGKKIKMKNNIKPLSRKDEIVVQELNGEILIYDLSTNKAFCLNETSSLVWEACDGSKSVSEISRLVSRKLNAPANEDLIWLALDQLKKEKLIANSEEVVSHFEGMPRREVIKKVGLASVIALPIVGSLVAPKSAMAQASACIGNCGMTLACPPVSTCMCSNNSAGNNGTCGL